MAERVTARDNPHSKQYIRLRTSARARRESGLFVMEGLRLCTDARQSGVRFETVFYTEDCLAQNTAPVEQLIQNSQRAYEISDGVAGRLADTKSPQGIFCVGYILDKSEQLATINKNSIYVGLEDMADPVNLGTILRTAEAFGVDGVILTGGCCDEYAPKVLRGSMGAVFRLPILHIESMTAFATEQAARGLPVFASVPDRTTRSILEADFSTGGLMLIGNEADGLRPETVRAATDRVTIPMDGGAESLNAAVAASILIWHMAAERNR